MAKKSKEAFLVGKIVSLHGVKGQVRINPFSENLLTYIKENKLIDKDEKEIPLEYSFSKKNLIICAIKNIPSRDEAEKFINLELFVNRKEVEKDEDEFFYEDLIGLDLIDASENKVGKITQIHNFGAGDIIEYIEEGSNKKRMANFNPENFPEINIENGFLLFSPPFEE